MAKNQKQSGKKDRKGKEPPMPAELANPLKEMMPNYRVYQMSGLEKLGTAAVAFLAGGVCSQIFYGGLFRQDGEDTILTYISAAIVILVVGLLAVKLFLPLRREQLRRKRQHQLSVQFRDMLESITTSLAAGDTVFQAFEAAENDICLQYGEDSDMARELQQVLNRGSPRL